METLEALSKIAQGGGPVLLIVVLWFAYRAVRVAEKAIESFTTMQADIASMKNVIVAQGPKCTEVAEAVGDIDKRMQSIDIHMVENGGKLDRLVAKVAA